MNILVQLADIILWTNTSDYTGGADAAFTSKMYLLWVHTFDCDILNNFYIEIQSIMGQMTLLGKWEMGGDGLLISEYSVCSRWVSG